MTSLKLLNLTKTTIYFKPKELLYIKQGMLAFVLLLVVAVDARGFMGAKPKEYWAGKTTSSSSTHSSIVKREGMWDPNFEIENETPTLVDIAVKDTGIKDFDIGKFMDKFVNATAADFAVMVDALEHPVRALSKSWLGLIFLSFLGIFLLVNLIRFLIPICRGVWGIIRYVFTSTLVVYICALKPCVSIRNYIRLKRLYRASKKSVIYGKVTEDREEIQLVKRHSSRVEYDTEGPYVTSSTGERIYVHKNQAADLVSSKRVREEQVDSSGYLAPQQHKETLIPGSKFYKENMPSWQGQFDVDGTIIGHFSRIKFHKRDCLLTASHVLSFNKTANIRLRKGDKYAYLSSVSAQIVAYSGPDELDFLIMAVPDFVFSQLGISVGKTTGKVRMGEVVNIRQIVKDETCVSTAVTRVVKGDPWKIQYGASTITSSSGAPLCNARNEIFGVHTGCDRVMAVNLGVVVPLFRYKESEMNEDAYNDLDLEEEDEDSPKEDRYTGEDIEEAVDRIRLRRTEHTHTHEYTSGNSWGEEMEAFDNLDERDLDDIRDKYKTIKTIKRSKSGKKTYESPWTCSKCNLLHLEPGFSCRRPGCGFALIKDPQGRRSQTEEIRAGLKLGLEELKNYLPEVVMDQVKVELNKEGLIAKEITAFVRKMVRETYSEITKAPVGIQAAEGEIYIGKKITDPSYAVVDGKLIKLATGILNEEESLACGGVVIDKNNKAGLLKAAKNGCGDVLSEVKSVEPVATSNKAKKRRAKATKLQEIKESVVSAVPLNSQSPATAGAPTTSGLNQKSSPLKVKSLVIAPSASTSPKDSKKTDIGKSSN